MLGITTSHHNIIEECVAQKRDNMALLAKARHENKECNVMNGMHPDTASIFVEMLLPNVLYLDKDKMEDKEVYPLNQRSRAGIRADERLLLVRKWLQDPLERPKGMKDKEYKHFIRYAQQFFLKDEKLYKKSQESMHKLVVEPQH